MAIWSRLSRQVQTAQPRQEMTLTTNHFYVHGRRLEHLISRIREKTEDRRAEWRDLGISSPASGSIASITSMVRKP